jgi:hypothetical protein
METGAGVRSSDRIRAQPNADDTQLQRAQRLAQAKDHATSPGTNFINKYSLKSFSNEVVVATASKLGISLGKSLIEIEESVDKIKNLDIQRTLTILKKNEEKARQNTEDTSSFLLNEMADMSEDVFLEEQEQGDDHKQVTTARTKRTYRKREPSNSVVRRSVRLKNKKVS